MYKSSEIAIIDQLSKAVLIFMQTYLSWLQILLNNSSLLKTRND